MSSFLLKFKVLCTGLNLVPGLRFEWKLSIRFGLKPPNEGIEFRPKWGV